MFFNFSTHYTRWDTYFFFLNEKEGETDLFSLLFRFLIKVQKGRDRSVRGGGGAYVLLTIQVGYIHTGATTTYHC